MSGRVSSGPSGGEAGAGALWGLSRDLGGMVVVVLLVEARGGQRDVVKARSRGVVAPTPRLTTQPRHTTTHHTTHGLESLT